MCRDNSCANKLGGDNDTRRRKERKKRDAGYSYKH